MALILPGYTFIDLGPDGGPYDEKAHVKVCIHTTEGSSIEGAEKAFAPYPPHLGYDPNKRIKHQYVSLDRHSYALKGDESDDEFVIQVEVVGFANDTHNWSDKGCQNFAEDVVVPLVQMFGVPLAAAQFYGEDAGFVLASPSSPIRFSDSAFRNFVGFLGHQHVPAPDSHWDPGKFRIQKVFELAAQMLAPKEEEDMQPIDKNTQERISNRLYAIENMMEHVGPVPLTPFGTGDPRDETLNEPVPIVVAVNKLANEVAELKSMVQQLLTKQTGPIEGSK